MSDHFSVERLLQSDTRNKTIDLFPKKKTSSDVIIAEFAVKERVYSICRIQKYLRSFLDFLLFVNLVRNEQIKQTNKQESLISHGVAKPSLWQTLFFEIFRIQTRKLWSVGWLHTKISNFTFMLKHTPKDITR